MFNTVKKTASSRPVFTHAIRKADSVVTHSDEKGIHFYEHGPAARSLTMGQLMALSIGPDLAVWSIADYETAGPHTVLYLVRYALRDDTVKLNRELTVELNSMAGTAALVEALNNGR